jgi:hypothetical protein
VALVALPAGPGWHFVNLDQIAAVKFAGPKRTTVVLNGGVLLECSEDTHVINKRIEDFVQFVGRTLEAAR